MCRCPNDTAVRAGLCTKEQCNKNEIVIDRACFQKVCPIQPFYFLKIQEKTQLDFWHIFVAFMESVARSSVLNKLISQSRF